MPGDGTMADTPVDYLSRRAVLERAEQLLYS